MDIEKAAIKWIADNPAASPQQIFLAGFKFYADFAEEIRLTKEKKTEQYKKQFYNSLIPYVAIYGKELVREFYDYWSEPNKSMTKIKYQLEATWDVKLRLERWQNNSKNIFKGKQVETPSQVNKRRNVID